MWLVGWRDWLPSLMGAWRVAVGGPTLTDAIGLRYVYKEE